MIMNKFNIKEQKNQIRDIYKEKRRSISAEKKSELDEAVCKRFLSLSSYRYADTILLYSPLKGEIDTLPIVRDAWAKGKKTAFPRCIDGNRMVYHYVTSEEQLVSGMYGIKEPSADLPLYSSAPFEHVICVLPAIVYDKRGYRLGYGRGYYDRFLSNFNGIKAGLIYSDFVVDEIPNGRFDLKSDVVITEKGVISFAKN